MKKKRIWIIAAAVAVMVAAVIIAACFMGKSEATLKQESTGTVAEPVVKAADNEFMMRIEEGADIDFSDSDEAEAKEERANVVSSLENGFCKSVIIKAKAFSKKYDAEKDGTKPDKEKNAAFYSFVRALKEKKLTVYAEVDASFSVAYIASLAESKNIDGIVLTGVGKAKAASVNKKLMSLNKKLKGKSDGRLILSLPLSYKELSSLKLDASHLDLLLLSQGAADNKADFEKSVEKMIETAEKSQAPKAVSFDLSPFTKDKLAPSLLLSSLIETEKNAKVKAVVFNSYRDAEENRQCCFSAVEQYVKDGIVMATAFQKLGIDGYNGEVSETDNYTLSLKINGSSLYPAYLDGESFLFDADGTAIIELSLKTGLNKFVISQNGEKITYKIKARFSGNLIKSVEPMPNITAYMSQKIKLTVYAASGSEVTVKVGAKTVKAKDNGYESGGYRRYTATIRMPDSRMELESIGQLHVTAVLDSKTETADGPTVVYSVPETTTSPAATLPASNDGKEASTSFSNGDVSVSAVTQVPTVGTTYETVEIPSIPYTGNQMCVVMNEYADTWPAGTNSDAFVPFYTTLAKGTMDYVVGQSEAYDSEEEKTRYFYELACGRRVLRENVMLLEKYDMGANSLSVVSCSSDGGELTVRLSTKWKVPYSFGFAPQSYHAGYNKLYNVESFTAEYIQFTFYHTTSASGKIDVSASDVVSSASWGTDSSSGCVTLTMPLRQKGKYYGYSLSYDANDNLVLTIHNKPQTLKGAVILLDPGHGGKDSGAVGYSGAVREADLNFNTAVAVMNELRKRGATVYLTRSGDSTLSLEERKAIARSVKPDVYISIHGNGSLNASNYGTSAYYFRPMSKPLAKSIYDELVSVWKELYASSPEKQTKLSRGCDFHPFSVTRLEECPSVLIEVGYVTNNDDCAVMADTASREKIAAAISDGIEKFICS